jgi:hypothetical protein
MRCAHISSAIVLASLCALAQAHDCDPAEFLTLTNGDASLAVTEAELSALPQKIITTSTHWAKKGSYRGPLLSDVIALAKVPAPKKLTVYTWDNFNVDIPISDLAKYGVILATSLNNERLKLDDWGPTFIMYPYDDNKELHRPAGLRKMAWQVCRLAIS